MVWPRFEQRFLRIQVLNFATVPKTKWVWCIRRNMEREIAVNFSLDSFVCLDSLRKAAEKLSRYPIYMPILEPGTYRIRSCSAHHNPTTKSSNSSGSDLNPRFLSFRVPDSWLQDFKLLLLFLTGIANVRDPNSVTRLWWRFRLMDKSRHCFIHWPGNGWRQWTSRKQSTMSDLTVSELVP